jgi:hypothetical protein
MTEPPLMNDLIGESPVKTLSTGVLDLHLNFSDKLQRVEADAIDLAAHSARILRTSNG